MTESLDLHDADGRRKYLTPDERAAFLRIAGRLPDRSARLLCLTLAHSGCRLSEALALTPARIDLAAGSIVIPSLKKRGKPHQRAVPVPPELTEALDLVFGLRAGATPVSALLWPISRMTAWRQVTVPMRALGFPPGDPRAQPKALRHAFAVQALMRGVPLTLLRRWLGHASLETTAIYLEVIGGEERALAERMWR